MNRHRKRLLEMLREISDTLDASRLLEEDHMLEKADFCYARM